MVGIEKRSIGNTICVFFTLKWDNFYIFKKTDAICAISSLGLSKLNASITTSAVFRAGRANETIDSCEIIVEQPIERFRCKYDGMCAVDWNGDVFWCCSVRNKNMILGNVKEDNINIILNKVRSNKLFLSIIKNAPFIIGRIRDRDLIKVEKKYADYCELCNEIFSDKSIVLRLEEEINSKLGKE